MLVSVPCMRYRLVDWVRSWPGALGARVRLVSFGFLFRVTWLGCFLGDNTGGFVVFFSNLADSQTGIPHTEASPLGEPRKAGKSHRCSHSFPPQEEVRIWVCLFVFFTCSVLRWGKVDGQWACTAPNHHLCSPDLGHFPVSAQTGKTGPVPQAALRSVRRMNAQSTPPLPSSRRSQELGAYSWLCGAVAGEGLRRDGALRFPTGFDAAAHVLDGATGASRLVPGFFSKENRFAYCCWIIVSMRRRKSPPSCWHCPYSPPRVRTHVALGQSPPWRPHSNLITSNDPVSLNSRVLQYGGVRIFNTWILRGYDPANSNAATRMNL